MTETRLIIGEVRDALRTLPDESIACCVTSPPYWGRRSYTGLDREIGVGDLDEYLDDLAEVFDLVGDKLAPDGLLWLNIGDTAANSGGAGGDHARGGRFEGKALYRQGQAGLDGNQWCDVPGRLLHRLQDQGWLCRSQIVWDKGRVRPEDPRHVRRPGEQHEMIFMLARTPAYVFHAELLPVRGDIWHFPSVRRRTGNQASFPTELPERCLRLSAIGPVLDPFVGAGTTMIAAQGHGRDAIGIDIDPAMGDIVRSNLGMFLDVELLAGQAGVGGAS